MIWSVLHPFFETLPKRFASQTTYRWEADPARSSTVTVAQEVCPFGAVGWCSGWCFFLKRLRKWCFSEKMVVFLWKNGVFFLIVFQPPFFSGETFRCETVKGVCICLFFLGWEGLEMFLEGKMKKLVFFKEGCASLCLVFGWYYMYYSQADRTPPKKRPPPSILTVLGEGGRDLLRGF